MSASSNRVQRVAQGAVVAFCFVATVGCSSDSPPTLKHKSRVVSQNWGGTTVNLCELEGKTAALVWFDSLLDLREAGNSSATTHVFQGKFPLPDGRKGEWRCEIQDSDGKTGELTIDGKAYDLAEGSLFLVSTGAEGPQVTQLKREVSGVRSAGGGLEELYRDPEVRKRLPEIKGKAP